MKIAFVGKGGSGKTTLASLFARHLASHGKTVLAIDADINQQLAAAIGATGRIGLPELGNHLPAIKDALRGENPRIVSSEHMVKTTPPGRGSALLKLHPLHPLLRAYGTEIEGVHLLATGGFRDEDLGVKCFHAKTGAVELLLNHLVDREDEFVIVDMTAGADAFASGLFTKFDVTLIVVEPTLASAAVYRQYKGYASGFGVPIAVIGNKVTDADEEAFLREEIGEDVLTIIPYSKAVKARDRGQATAAEADTELLTAFHALEDLLMRTKKDWDRFYRHAVDFHVRNAKSWANASVGTDLATQIDPEFGPADFLAVLS
ncbi:ATP-binding protein [Candidatus Uhrbacteria bacterium]|nr:MAG: ATP-binding protein [Candidatus Uhrbacteria bacterium]